MTLTYTTSPATEKLFQAIIEKSDSRDIKGLACLSLGAAQEPVREGPEH